MGQDIMFLLERRECGRWISPPELVNREQDPPLSGAAVVCWWTARNRLTDLFFGDNALYPLQQGWPEDVCPETQRQGSIQFPWGISYPAWTSVADLYLDRWETQNVLLGGMVAARYAKLFTDGLSPEPVDALSEAGVEGPVIPRVTDWTYSLRKHPENWTGTRGQYLDLGTGNELVPVTWVTPLAEYAAALWTPREFSASDIGLKSVRDLRRSGEYRIIIRIC